MDRVTLTKDADALICVIYKEYLQRRKVGATKRNAREMGGSATIRNDLLPKWQFEDVDDACRELSRNGLLDCIFADNAAWAVSLSGQGILYMEKRFQNGLASILPYIEALGAILPLL